MKRFILAGLLMVSATMVRAESYTIDAAHSSVAFKVKHLVGKVPGYFNRFSGVVNYDQAKPEKLEVEATIDAASINTANEKRDEHLRKPDFFDVAKYPTITFKSSKATVVSANKVKLDGQLTMHGVTKPVTLDVDLGGVAPGMNGAQVTGASATTIVNRGDFGVGATTGMGGSMIGKDIEITIDIEAATLPKKK